MAYQPNAPRKWLRDENGKRYEVSDVLHTCSLCGKVERWGETWEWYGSYKDIDDGKPIIKVCGQPCKAQPEEIKKAMTRAQIRAGWL